MVEPREVATGVTLIDTEILGMRKTAAAYVVSADEPALVDPGPASSAEIVISTLHDLGIGSLDLKHIILTHTHVDHAGGSGMFLRQFPDATLWVHADGASNLVDPRALVELTLALHGRSRLHQLGPVEPVMQARVRVLSEGDSVHLGSRRLDVMHTPGHARDHICLYDDAGGTLFAGEALGIYLPDVGVLRPSMPPPDADVELAIESINRIRNRRKQALLLSHFGSVADADDLCALAVTELLQWTEIVRKALEEEA